MAEVHKPQKHSSDDSVKLFVGQVPKHIRESELASLFQKFAIIDQVNIIKDKATRASRGCCFVICPSRGEADKAIDACHNKKKPCLGPEEYDQIVSAEIPNEKHNPHLHKMVVRHMLHGPCGRLKPDNVCMKKNGMCKNSYPKAYANETTQTTAPYPIYRRRKDGLGLNLKQLAGLDED